MRSMVLRPGYEQFRVEVSVYAVPGRREETKRTWSDNNPDCSALSTSVPYGPAINWGQFLSGESC